MDLDADRVPTMDLGRLSREFWVFTREINGCCDQVSRHGEFLYTMSSEGWQYFMPEKEHGISIYNILISERSKNGAVPAGVTFRHWKKS